MITLENKDIPTLLINLQGLRGDKPFGLLIEEIPMSLRRRLQKIQKDALKVYEELMKDYQQIEDELAKRAAKLLPEGANAEDYKKARKGDDLFLPWQKLLEEVNASDVSGDYRKVEREKLEKETVEIRQDFASLSMIELIKTAENYDWDIIEKIAK